VDRSWLTLVASPSDVRFLQILQEPRGALTRHRTPPTGSNARRSPAAALVTTNPEDTRGKLVDVATGDGVARSARVTKNT